jgi:hypothetical protein
MDTAQLTTMIATMTGRPDDPTVQGFAQLLASALGDDDVVEQRAMQRARRRRAAMQQVAHIQRLMQHMGDRNRFIAGALGACECWGADGRCSRCAGRGGPGTFDPDASAFALLVLPLARAHPELFDPLSADATAGSIHDDTGPRGGNHAGQPH